MSLTLLYRGKNVSFLMKLKKLHWVSLLIVFFLLSGGLIHLIFSGNAIPEQPLYSMASELETPHNIQQGNPQQLTALTMKLAELQSQVLRINALGERLAEASNIPEKEFNFNELPPSGGPSVEYEDITAKSIKELSKDISSLEDLMLTFANAEDSETAVNTTGR